MLYLGAASGTSVSHVSDIVGPKGLVYVSQILRGMLASAKVQPGGRVLSQIGPRSCGNGCETHKRKPSYSSAIIQVT